jgi:hypothetical protein
MERRRGVSFERSGRDLSDLLVLLGARRTGDADGADDLTFHDDRNASLQRQELRIGDQRQASVLDGVFEDARRLAEVGGGPRLGDGDVGRAITTARTNLTSLLMALLVSIVR